jgi:DNA polymerase I-like protein with 3'-5' exonuclease and polymerase domains
LRCWKEGVFDVIGVPKLQVHDELDFSVIDNSPQHNEAYSYMRRVLETTVPLRVPVIVESGRGPNWGAIE